MKLTIPLFQYISDDEKEFEFSSRPFSIGRIDIKHDIPKIDLFSNQDIKNIQQVEWCIIIDGKIPENYEEEINLLVMAFRIVTRCNVFAKYILCSSEISKNRRINEVITYIIEDNCAIVNYSELTNIDKIFSRILEMKETSDRTQNALYFLYRAFHTTHWVDSFIMFVCFLESLFSKDKIGGVTKTICTRVNNYIKDPKIVTYQSVENLYNLRSDMVHGRIITSNRSSSYNLVELKKLEDLAIHIISKMLLSQDYNYYENKNCREIFLGRIS